MNFITQSERLRDVVRFAKFAAVGGAGLSIKLLVTYALTEYFRLWYFISFIVAAFLGWTFIFLANSLFTFAGHSKEGYLKRYGTFLLGYLNTFWINGALVLIFTSGLRIMYLVSIILASVITSAITFFFSSRFVYHD